MRTWAAGLLLLLASIAGIGPAYADERPPLMLAAASLQEAMTAAADAWTRAGHPRPVLSFAASSALARQAQAGGAADLFVSADENWMDVLDREGRLVPGSRANLLRNRLVVIAPAGRGQRITRKNIARLLGAGPVAMADPDAVPAGRYGRQALTSLGAWPTLSRRVVRAANVRAALVLVERGAAPYGIVYATDARASAKVHVVGVFPARSHSPIVYPIARLKAGRSGSAEAFRRFLLSAPARAIFARFGFGGA